jgi:glycogen debranching enzyme
VFIDLKEKTDNKKVLHNDVARISGQIIPDSLIKADERIYSRIPLIRFGDPDRAMLYWSAFSLMRQCMMPPEGACRKNYYVFSREPKWGWGYGGQVFHESLVMLAYAYMDPESAMNSQRVYMDRQRDDGYINYRTGPYLDETIETNGQPTSSAPWYNYQNLEVWKITKDRGFLKEAYASGKRFYQYYTARRDSNQNGLCEWGGHAELESVRDARVATWDQVGWASNFEGPDVNSMLVSEAQALAEMAAALGLKQESEAWERDAATRGKKINEKMWDPESGFYFNISKNDQAFTFKTRDDLKIREIIGFLPMWAGVTDRQQISLLVSNLMDTNTFWRRYGVPSLSAAHAYYCPIGYWNGPVWVQWNYLIYQGLKSYGYHSEASELTNRVVDNMVFHLKTDHTFWEFYSADDHHAGWNKTYIWAGIVARFLIDEHKNLIK